MTVPKTQLEGVIASRMDLSKTNRKAVVSLGAGLTSLLCLLPFEYALYFGFAGIPAVLFGFFSRRTLPRSRFAVVGILTGSLGVLLAMYIAFVNSLNRIEDDKWSDLRCRYLVVAMHNYAEKHGCLPPAATTTRDGQPLLSWRVLLLPYMEEKALYDQFHLNEPWDSPHNIQLLPKMPLEYRCPRHGPNSKPYDTFMHVFVGERTPFEEGKVFRIPKDFDDGLARTILVVQGGPAVPWTKPEDIPYHPGHPLPDLGNVTSLGIYVGMADGRVHVIRKSASERNIRAAITRNGGEKLEENWWK